MDEMLRMFYCSSEAQSDRTTTNFMNLNASRAFSAPSRHGILRHRRSFLIPHHWVTRGKISYTVLLRLVLQITGTITSNVPEESKGRLYLPPESFFFSRTNARCAHFAP